MKRHLTCLLALHLLACGWMALGQQKMDEEYGARIREYTTDPRFLNELVDHLPLSETVPSPLQHFGQVIGAPGVLHYTHELYSYLRKLADASPRVSTRKIGESEEGRDMIEVIIADQSLLQDLETYRRYLNQLSDPRRISSPEAEEIIRRARPVYYLTAGLHSPETGSPEMLMELAYRLAVEDSELIRTIRENVIVVFTIAEPDGRDRMVDVYRYRKAHRDVGPGLIYWGHYVAHDNNRDGFGLALNLTRNILDSFLHWKATVMHDLHESVPYLYASTGTGPYNEYLDPITIQEWQNLAHEEVTELTRRGMPGVWTHGFYTGWAANYLIWIANNRNAIGRFYETFGNSIAETVERKLTSRQTRRHWYRPNPPLETVQWSLRNNTNYMQSGVLSALGYVARNRDRFVENFYTKSANAVRRGREEAPHAYVIPADQKRPLAARQLANLLRRQGLEVHRAGSGLSWTGGGEDGGSDDAATTSAAAGSLLVRMDQPYRTLARILLDRQNFPEEAEAPYDDTGWSLPHLHQVTVHRVDDLSVLEAPMELVTADLRRSGGIEMEGDTLLLHNTTEDEITVFRFRLSDVPMQASEEAFEVEGRTFAAGSLIIDAGEPRVRERIREAARELGLTLHAVSQQPEVPAHELEVPAVGLVHTWVSTPQDAGWWRFAFDRIGIPYTHLSEQDLSSRDLDAFDVIIMPGTRANPQTLVAGTTSAGEAVAWKRTEEYRHIGRIDESEDVRRGMGYEGLSRLKAFIEKGGVFITEGSTARLPIEMAITRRVSIRRTSNLVARGTVVRIARTDEKSPISYGYDDSLAVYFNQAPVFRIDRNLGGFRVPDWLKDEIWAKEVPREVFRFAPRDLLLSGMLRGERELAGTPAVLDVPVGEGHVVLFANRPFWRWQTRGSHALVFNALLHWNDLRAGWPERPEEESADTPGAAGGPLFP